MLGARTSAAPREPVVWDPSRRVHRVQVFGADGPVGREVLVELLRAGHPTEGLEIYASRPCAYTWRGARLDARVARAGFPRGDLAFVCTAADHARQLVPILLARGTRVVDLSGAQRRRAEIQLVVDPINGRSIGAFTEMIAVPSGTTVLLARLLHVFDRGPGLLGADCVALVAASGERARGRSPAEVERALDEDVRRLLARPDLDLDVSVVDAERARCDAFVVKLRSRPWLDPERAAGLLAGIPGIELETAPGGPDPASCAGSERIHVGRIRAGSRGPGSLCFFAVGDQLRAGAAQAALRAANRFPTLG